MPHPVSCPACGVPMQLPDDSPGRSFQCIRCGVALVTTTGGQLATQSGPVQPANPFADPPAGFSYPGGYSPSPFAPGYFAPPVMSREMALAKVRGSALMIQGFGWLLIVAAIPAAALYFVVDHDRHPVSAVVSFGAAPVALLLDAFAVYCGSQLKALRSYWFVMVSLVVMMVAGLLVCLLALPGIWPMIVMLDSGVKAHFGKPPMAA